MSFENRFTLRAEYVLKNSHECAAEMGHGYVGSEHILLGILRDGEGQAAKLLESAGVTSEKVRAKICEKTGMGDIAKNTAQGLSPCARRIVKSAYDESKRTNSPFIGTEHLLFGIVTEEMGTAKKILDELGADTKKLQVCIMSSGSEGEAEYRRAGDQRQNKDKNEIKQLKSFGRDICELARAGRFDPVIGRENETERMLRILSRRTKNNPLLLGEPGVGKTAVVEGLAQRIAEGTVPQPLLGKRIYMVDVSSMVAGTKYRGEFEERIKAMLREVIRARDIILFIDEIHTIVGAGSAEGAIDAANILKPAMSRREIQIIGATTFDEYRKYIERDSALARRFQTVEVKEPDGERALEILSGLRKKYEEHHRVTITDSAMRAAVEYSTQYINDRRLPDKAIDLIDEAASRQKLYTSSPPPRMRELEQEIVNTVALKEMRVREQDYEMAAMLRNKEHALRAELRVISDGWQRVIDGKAEIDSEDVATVVSEQTGIPVSQIKETETERLLKLEEILSEKIIGQKEAINAVARAVRRGRCGFGDRRRPIGSFLFAGPTGVGKTELCKVLAKTLFGDEKKIIRMDMSEYMEKHEVSKLIGSPPGYIGHEDGGTLTERVRRSPYYVVLFDEIVKAHPDVANLLLQILEDGVLTDSHGKTADFTNTVIVMTSNIGAAKMQSEAMGFSGNRENDAEKIKKSVLSDIKKSFAPELINRIDEIVVFEKLSESEIESICDIFLNEFLKRAKEKGVYAEITDEAKALIIKKGYSDKYGARPIRREIRRSVEDAVSELYLKNKCKGGRCRIYADGDEIKIQYAAE
ncbi:MAG: ATP-dependent Clp protease ATP-binding subunit [Oscillospiraceae bacterium]|nr:ATP-dependent Clp protease ATP-binding subunit [Oscillospiraceae bacterium]